MRMKPKLGLAIAAALGFLLVVAVGALAIMAGVESRSAALKNAETSAEKLALVVEQSLSRTFEAYALSLDGAVRVLENGTVDGLPPALQRLVLFDNAARASDLGSIVFLDASGQIVFDSRSDTPRGGSFADREHFKAQERADVGLYISAPFISRLDQAWSVALSRRVNHPDGSFRGVVTGTIKLAELRQLFARLAGDNSGSTFSLFRTDGVALVRWPHLDAEVGQNFAHVGVFRRLSGASHGTFDQVALRDGVARRYVYSRVGSLPLVFSIGLAFDDVLREWRQKAQTMAGLGGAIVFIFIGLAVLLWRELTRRRVAERDALAAASRFEQLARNSNDAIVLRDMSGRRTYASPKFYDLIGRTADEVGETGLQAYLHPESRKLPATTIRRLLRGERQVSEMLHCIRPDGTSIWLEAVSRLVRRPDGNSSEILTNIRDMTEHKLHTDASERRRRELEALAHLDGLTGIANRRAFDAAYADELARSAGVHRPVSVLMIDVDHFKAFNDHRGHVAGDDVLRQVAACVAGVARRPDDVAARYGGEEFVLLLPAIDAAGAGQIAERLLTAVRGLQIPHPTGGFLSVSIGVATASPAHAVDLLKAADAALYAAKTAGRDQAQAFQSPQNILPFVAAR